MLCGATRSPAVAAALTTQLTSSTVRGVATAAGRWSTAVFHGTRSASYAGSPGQRDAVGTGLLDRGGGVEDGRGDGHGGSFWGVSGCEGDGEGDQLTGSVEAVDLADAGVRTCSGRGQPVREDVQHPEKGDPVGGAHLDLGQPGRGPAPRGQGGLEAGGGQRELGRHVVLVQEPAQVVDGLGGR